MSDLADRLRDLDRQGLRRRRRSVEGAQGSHLTVDGRRCLAFCSNDYLGLANHPALIEAACAAAKRYGVGAGASHLISGHTAAHDELEDALARFCGTPRALYFSTGYSANLAVVPALVGRGDAVFSDALNHASLIDATRLSRADVHVYPHVDVAALEVQLAASTAPHKLVATDAVFSMDGDVAPLPALFEVCERYDAWLLVDDAHGFGVLGPGGRGTAAQFGLRSARLVYMGTLGKAGGVAGAFAAGADDVIEWLVQRGRTYIYTTATPPMLAGALLASLPIIEQDEWRRERLRELIARLRNGLAGLPWRLIDSQTAIQPLLVGESAAAVSLSERLFELGIWIPAIRPPTVPAGTARLRISLSAAHEAGDVDRLIDALRSLAR